MRKLLLVFLASTALTAPIPAYAEKEAPLPVIAPGSKDAWEAKNRAARSTPAPVQASAPVESAAPAAQTGQMKPVIAPKKKKPVNPKPVAKPVAKPAPKPAEKPVEKAVKAVSGAHVTFQDKGSFQRAIIAFGKRPKISKTNDAANKITISFLAEPNVDIPTIPAEFTKSFTSFAKNGKVLTIEHKPGDAKINLTATSIIIDVTSSAAPEAKVETKAAAPETAKAEEVKASPAAVGTPKAEFTKEGDIERLRITFSTPTPAAVFERFGYYWLVFYTNDKIQLPQNISESALFSANKLVTPVKSESLDAEKYPAVATPLVFNLALNKNANAMAEENGTEWLIEFDPNIKYDQEGALKLNDTTDSWQIEHSGVSGRVTIKDDLTNDMLEVFPLEGKGFIANKTTNNKFTLEKTVQGVVIKPIGGLSLRNDEKGKIKIPKGAVGSEANASIKKSDLVAKPIFPMKKWPQLKSEEFRTQEQKLKKGDHYEFAKFLFSQSLYAESAVNLQGVPGMQASFLTGASLYMIGRYEDAIKNFETISVPADVDPNELKMWLAAANYELYQTKPTLAKPVDLTDFYLPKNIDNYPDNIKKRLYTSLIERLIDDGKFDDAQWILNAYPKEGLTLPEQNYNKYLQAKIYDGQNKRARAYELWTQVANAKTDRESQAKSTFETIVQDYALNKIKPDEAIKRLNDIRILWRGDMFEYRLLSQLADIYNRNGDAFEALQVYKEILSSFPRYPNNLMIAAKMREIYQTALKKDFTDREKTFRAVTIYYEFDELKPAGPEGAEITLKLADSLARYDLLDDAANVLKKYMETLTDPVQKAEMGARIAILYYLNSKPKDALQTLEATSSADIPGYLMQERKILQIRSLIDIGDLEKASSMLNSLPDQTANRFKADIFWKQKRWQDMLNIYNFLNDKSDEDIMRIAIANVMLGKKDALASLNKAYADRMAKSPYAQSFDFVTDTKNVDYRNLDNSLQLDQTQDLLKQYRSRLQNQGLEGVTKSAAPTQATAPAPAATTQPAAPASAPAATN